MLYIRMIALVMFFSLFLHADVKKMLDMSEKLDKLDSQEFSFFVEKADQCTDRRDFDCAASYHEKAKNLATTASLKAKLQASVSQRDNEIERMYREKRALEQEEQEEEERREREAIERQRLAQQEEDAYDQAQRNANMSNFMMQKMNETNPFNQPFNRQVPRTNNYIPPQPQYRSNEYKPQTQTTQNTHKQSYTNQTPPQYTPPPQTTQQPVTQTQKSFTPIIKNDVSYTHGLTYKQSQTWCKRKADEMRSWNWSPHQLISIGECSCGLGKNSVANDSKMLQKEYSCELKYVWQQNSVGGAR